jgi:hypothetical protein
MMMGSLRGRRMQCCFFWVLFDQGARTPEVDDGTPGHHAGHE